MASVGASGKEEQHRHPSRVPPPPIAHLEDVRNRPGRGLCGKRLQGLRPPPDATRCVVCLDLRDSDPFYKRLRGL